MQQFYHSNSKTNVHIREQIQLDKKIPSYELALKYNISSNTVNKWRNRNETNDRSSAPKNIAYSLSDIESALVVSIRRSTWFSLDEVYETLLEQNSSISRSSVYRCFLKNGINVVPVVEKEKAKKFKAYEPGYLHIDVTYMPKFNKEGSYLYVAIDRATRVMYYTIFEFKTAASTEAFFNQCLDFFPFTITHILTDNGLEFTNRLINSKKGNLCTKPSLLDIKCTENEIEHRCTLPCTPQTNGMVERVNGIIKNNTILKHQYDNKIALINNLKEFLVFYNLYRRHGSLRKELNVKTPFQAIEKWYQLKPELFKTNPEDFKNKILLLKPEIIN
jgi:transposase-like protein